MATHRTLLVFGPGIMSLDEPYFSRIIKFAKHDGASQWAVHAIEEIEHFWASLCEAIPKLQLTPALAHAKQLVEWLRSGLLPPNLSVAALPNAILGPLVVIAQLVEYLQYLDSLTASGLEDGKAFFVPSRLYTETVGCCLGVFSSIVVSSSATWTQFSHHASVVIRTIFVLGALSDAEDAWDSAGPSKSLIASWKGGQSSFFLQETLAKFPEAYASVLYDDNRATITTSSRGMAGLKDGLQRAGMTTNEVEFHGRFHADGLYRKDLGDFFRYCQESPAFQLPDSSLLVLPTRVNSEYVLAGQENLIEVASRAFLVQQFNWIKTFRSAVTASLQDRQSKLIEFGPERCVPPTLLRRIGSQITHFGLERSLQALENREDIECKHVIAEDDVAVIGMSCNVAGAEDLQNYREILLRGQSQHRELLPNDRFSMETVFRPKENGDEQKKWHGNFINNHDAFDYKFFGKSPREALHMDPQQRLMLQMAYQAVSQSGYYHWKRPDARIGCYIGVVANDYENNISHTSPTAFSATGALRSYIAGKVSHFFGWTGPGMTVDTACSASTVAIDLACRAILSGDCTAALAGGTNVYSTPMFFQNLAAGSFLSPTGQCKPFDAEADGYCRGEAIGAVFLKKLSKAVDDGDQVLGVIKATFINQNLNTTPIFVPNSSSLTEVFRAVVLKSGLDPKDVSFVEAHGTGTPVGDPIEYDSIRQVLGGSVRDGLKPLQIGSVKGLIGHTEGASGVVALIKVLLMMHGAYIPPQASFTCINPAIKAAPSDNMEITTDAIPWSENNKIALINNYGAAGSNASMVVEQAPILALKMGKITAIDEPPSSHRLMHPVYLTGLDEKSITAYTLRLRDFIRKTQASGAKMNLDDLAFNLNRQSNWSLGRALIFSFKSTNELEQSLSSFKTHPVPRLRPVILCFGGQVSKFIGLDRQVFERATVLKYHLDRCDDACKSIGAASIYPAIFQRDDIDDSSVLQPLLFAMQYSCAMSWLDCGVEATALVGHSFGELTALCVSGTLDLTSALRMIYGRSKIIRDSWGVEKGAMIAIEADLAHIESLLEESNARLGKGRSGDHVTVACFNGPRNFTLAGSSAGVNYFLETISSREHATLNVKYKRLDVTNAFHSSFVENLSERLRALGHTLSFGKANIPLERATREHQSNALNGLYIAEHMREPVYFHQAVQRLAKQYPEAIWLEAGSNSTVTSMAYKALNRPQGSHFQSISIADTLCGLQRLTEATLGLWRAGLPCSFWPHSRRQTYHYSPVILPPYQFEKHGHWLPFKTPPLPVVDATLSEGGESDAHVMPKTLFDFLGFSGSSGTKCRFRINTTVKEYVDANEDYLLNKKTKSCPLTFQISIAVQAAATIEPEVAENENLCPQIRNVESKGLITTDHTTAIFIICERFESQCHGWDFAFISENDKGDEILHLTGQICFQSIDNVRSRAEFNRLGRLITHERCVQALEAGNDADEVIQGQNVYKIFSGTVDYGRKYQNLKKIVGRRNESAGKLVGSRSSLGWPDYALGDGFFQVASVWANCMSTDGKSRTDHIYASTGVEEWIRSPELIHKMTEELHGFDRTREWHVLAQHTYTHSDKSFITDIFVFDSESGLLEEAILGVRYMPLSRERCLAGISSSPPCVSSLNSSAGSQRTLMNAATSVLISDEAHDGRHLTKPSIPTIGSQNLAGKGKKDSKADIWARLLPVLADISGLEPEEIKTTDTLADIGIDSLMGMEMAREVARTFHCVLEQSQLVSIVDVPGILDFLGATLGSHDGDQVSEHSEPSSENSPFPFDAGTPTTPNSVLEEPEFPGTSRNADEVVEMPTAAVLEAFHESKARTDHLLKVYGCSGYLNGVSQGQTRLCLVLTIEAFKKLGCDLEAAQPGQALQPVPCVERHQRFHEHLYKMLEETRIINVDGDVMTRTGIPLPSQSAEKILEDLIRHHSDNTSAHQLTYNVGSRMADVLLGNTDGPQLIFGDAKNRDLVANFYGDLPFNKLYFEQMADFLTRLVSKMRLSPHNPAKIKILEMGAGTGGTTKVLVPVLAELGIPVEYTFTDLSPSLVAQVKRKFKQYSFMKFDVHDIEKPPSDADLFGSQHIVIASNAVHATHSLEVSTANILKFLRPDGFLMMLEMMETLHWVDVVWGTLEGWWAFDDGRTHAIVDEKQWKTELLNAGYKQVEWTDGKLPEVRVQRVLIALAADAEMLDGRSRDLQGSDATTKRHDYLPDDELGALKATADEYVANRIRDFSIPRCSESGSPTMHVHASVNAGACILITGATGSLGSHILTHLAGLESVHTIYCLNRSGLRTENRDPLTRQIQALESKGINLDEKMLLKLRVLEADSSKTMLGLTKDWYEKLRRTVTHIVHNAFPVNGLRTLKQNEPQLTTMRNLVDLAAGASARRRQDDGDSSFKITFQFISSLSAVGRYPLAHGGNTDVPEEALDVDSALPNGYGRAKMICERILQETLGRHPDQFRAMTVRLGQLSGSTRTGYWNHMEVLGFLFKSAQTLRSFPAVDGVLSWLPLEEASASLADLLLRNEAFDCHAVYHVDNPVRREWTEMVRVISEALGIPQKGIVPLKDWLRRVQMYPGEDPWDNPAAKALDFFEHKFEHMSCGGVTMATDKARDHSATLRCVRPVSDDVVRKYLQVWQRSGFLRC